MINAVNDIKNSADIRLYPNPAVSLVNIDLNRFKASGIILYNQLGEKVIQLTPDKNISTFNVSALPCFILFSKGLYVL